FTSLIAAGMPLLVAGLAIPTSLGIISLVAQQTEMSIYVLNIATMLGLALAIDYSLFLTSRFREELARGRTVERAVERAVGTAGKAVLFSGVAVAIGLSGLLWFQASALTSIGVGGSIVVLACSPFLRLQQGIPDATVYPAGVSSRDAWVALQTEFRAGETTPIVILLDTRDAPTSETAIAAVSAAGDRLDALDGIDRVEGPFSLTNPATGAAMTAAEVAQAYNAPAGSLPPE